VPGSKTYDTLAVKVMDGQTVEATDIKGGKVTESGKTFMPDATPHPEGSRQPAGPHEASGSWRTLKSRADGMMTNPIGESFNAKFDGKDDPIQGNTA